MEINVSDYESISYIRYNNPLAFDLSQIKQCSIKGELFVVESISGAIVSYRKNNILMKKKDS